jgi:transglutaminase-like putative cysteine protease
MGHLRRDFLKTSAAALAGCALPAIAFAQSSAGRAFDPEPGAWHTYDVMTRIDIAKASGSTKLWLPIPSVDTDWQQSLENSFAANGDTQLASDGTYGAKMLYVSFPDIVEQPFAEITSRVRTRDRATDWSRRSEAHLEPDTRRFWTRPTRLLPTDGIVHRAAMGATRSARQDVDKAQMLYDWIVSNCYREPKVRGCGEGDIKTMLETGNLGGKCADLNALFVGMARSVGLPARDVYGLRLAPSRFGYKELGGNPASLKGAQHCRAEVYLDAHGWVAMDPADVAKVMRLETPEWIKTVRNDVVAPVNKALFGGWEGNWVAWNNAHDVQLVNATGQRPGFFMYPIGTSASGQFDSYSPDDFKYEITARVVSDA